MELYTPNGRKAYGDAIDLIVKDDLPPLKTILIESANGSPLILRDAIHPLSKLFPELYSPIAETEYVIDLGKKTIKDLGHVQCTIEDIMFNLKTDAKLQNISEATVMENILHFKTKEKDIISFIEQLFKNGFKYETIPETPVPKNEALAKKIIGKIAIDHAKKN